MKKKKGSALITVLAVAIVVMFLSGIIMIAINSTTKSNINQKEVEDLRYAAESGIETARGRMKEEPIVNGDPNNGGTIIYPSIDTTVAPDSGLVTHLVKGVVGNVEVKSSTTPTSKYIDIESIATHKDKPEVKQKAKYRYRKNKNGGGSVLDYGLVAGSGDITIEYLAGIDGTNLNDSHISKPEEELVTINGTEYKGRKPGAPVGEGAEKNNLSNNTFGDLDIINMKSTKEILATPRNNANLISYDEFKFVDKNNTEIIPTKLEVNDTDKVKYQYNNGTEEEITLDEIKGKEKSEIVKLKVSFTSAHVREFLIFNCDKLQFKLSTGNVSLNNAIVLAKGKVHFTGERGGFKATAGTVYGQSVLIDDSVGAVHFAFETAGGSGHGISDVQEAKLNNVLNKIIANWDKDTGLKKQWISEVSGSFDNE